MKYYLILLLVTFAVNACNQTNHIRILQGYVVYLTNDNIRFVETIAKPDTNYKTNFSNENFKNAMSFSPNCEIKRLIESIKPDTLFDENPELKQHAEFMRQPLIFPAEVTIVDTTDKMREGELKRFKMVMDGKQIEFNYHFLNKGLVVNLTRVNFNSLNN